MMQLTHKAPRRSEGFILVAMLTIAAVVSLFVMHAIDESIIGSRLSHNFYVQAQIDAALSVALAQAKTTLATTSNPTAKFLPLCDRVVCSGRALLHQNNVHWISVHFSDGLPFDGAVTYNIQHVESLVNNQDIYLVTMRIDDAHFSRMVQRFIC